VIRFPQLTTADGTAITSGATVTVGKDDSDSASAGTLAHIANGRWKYTPTQSETDCAILGLTLDGASAVPVVLNLITTGADTSAVAFGANTVAPLDAAGTRLAIGLASANLDTQLADIPTVAEFDTRTLPSADYFVVGDYTAPLDAAGIRFAIGLASANLDTQIADLPTVAEFEARTLAAANYFDPAVDVVARVTLVDTTTTNTDMVSEPLDATQTQSSVEAAIIANSTISNLDSMIEDVSGNRFTKKALEQTSGGLQAYPGLKRSVSDDTAINFVWPTIDTITAEKSFNGGSYSAIAGSITFLRTENDENWYSLSYNSSDRPIEEGTVRYKLTDGDVTKFLNLYVYDTAEKVIESVESSETTILDAISNIDVDLQPLLDALEDLDIDLTPVLEAIEELKLRISSAVIQIISPLSSDGTTLTVIQGDDYLAIDGRNILFTSDVEDQWPDLTDSNIVFGVYGTNILKQCVVISGTGTQQISLELTSIETFVPQGTYDYDVQATLENGSVITLFRGKFISVKSYTN
jgi:hypothetical protein